MDDLAVGLRVERCRGVVGEEPRREQLDPRRRQVRITDIWVDSATSLEGGRSLWAIPKELAKLDVDSRTAAATQAVRLNLV